MLNIGLIIPAAGLSTRFPPNKLLLEIDGSSVIERTLDNLKTMGWPIHVILGHMADEFNELLEPRVSNSLSLHVNPDYEAGLSGSVKLGVEAVGPNVDYFAFCPGDKPFLKQETLQQCLEILQKERPPILIPRFRATNGHPSFFAAEFYEELLEIEGDGGGRSLVKQHENQVKYVDLQDEGIVLDMDAFLSSQEGQQ